MSAEKAILCVLFEEFSKPNEIGINTCLILQNTLNVTVTAHAVQNKRKHPNQVKGFVETVSNPIAHRFQKTCRSTMKPLTTSLSLNVPQVCG